MKTLNRAIIIVVLVITQQAAAQKLTIYKTFGNVIFMLNDSMQQSMKQTAMLVYQNQPAYEEFNKARSRHRISSVFGFAGTGMLAIPIATVAFGEKSDWGLVAGGGASLFMFYLFDRWFKARAVYAVDLYNEHLQQKTSRIKPEFSFYGTGAKLVIKF